MMNKTQIWMSGLQCVLILSGILFRAKEYLLNRSFWLDEAYVALGISIQSVKDILSFYLFAPDLPLPPSGFLLLEKICVMILGNSEWSLRLFPFICSLLSLFLFSVVTKKYLKDFQRPFALGLFVFSEMLVIYSAELKQYSCDVLYVLIFLIMVDVLQNPKTGYRKTFFLSLVSCVLLFFTYISVFLMIPFLCVVCVEGVKRRSLFFKKGVLFFTAWAGGFLYQYRFILSSLGKNKVLNAGAVAHSYFPESSWPLFEHGKWAAASLVRMMENPVGLPFGIIIMFFFLVGGWIIYRKDANKGILLIFPLGGVLAASLIHKYPFGDRFLLFYLPMVYVLLVEGYTFFYCQLKKYKMELWGWVLLCICFFYPVQSTLYRFTHDLSREEIRPVLKKFFKEYQKGDYVFLNIPAKFALGYYHGVWGLGKEEITVGEFLCKTEEASDKIDYHPIIYRFNENGFLNDMEMENPCDESGNRFFSPVDFKSRTWVLLTHTNDECVHDVNHIFEQNTKRTGVYRDKGSYLFLYESRQEGIERNLPWQN